MLRNPSVALHAACAVRIIFMGLRCGRNRILEVASSIVVAMTAAALDTRLLQNVHIIVLMHISAATALFRA